jgi:hypothetical protein
MTMKGKGKGKEERKPDIKKKDCVPCLDNKMAA